MRFGLLSLLAVVGGCAADAGGTPAPGPVCAPASSTPAVVPVSASSVDLKVGAFTKVLDVPGHYVNDHTFYPKNGRWHLYGIYGVQPRPDGQEETDFVHATADTSDPAAWNASTFMVAPSLALTARRDLDEVNIWAPHVIAHGDEALMFFHSGDPAGNGRIASATSPDLETWTRSPPTPLFADICVTRDPMVLEADGQWVMYYTRCNDVCDGKSAVAYRTSTDLVAWSEPALALTLDWSSATNNAAYTESPFVFHRGGFWYLSVTSYPVDWVATLLFRSTTPYHFDAAPVARIQAHAAEWIAKDGDLEHEPLFVTHAGPGQEGVFIASVEGL